MNRRLIKPIAMNTTKSPTRYFAKIPVKVLLALVLVFLAVIAALAIAHSLMDRDRLKSQLLSELSHMVGSPLEAQDAVSISFVPEFKATLHTVTSSNPAAPISLKSKTIEIALAPWPALIGKIEARAVRFEDATFSVRLSELSALYANWANKALGQSIETAAQKISSNTTAPDFTGIENRKLGLISFKNCDFAFIKPDGTQELASQVVGTIDWPNLYSSATIDLNASWRAEPVEFKSAIMQPLVFVAGGTSDVGLNINSAPLELSFQGQSNLVSDFFADGKLHLQTPSLERFLSWTRASPTAGQAIGDVELDATLTTKEGKLFFDDVAMQLSGSPASGTLEIDPVSKPIKTSGTLAFKSVDLGVLGASLPIGMAANANADLDLLNTIDLDLRLSSEQARIGNLTIADAAGAIRIAKGEANLDLGTGTIGGGTLIARLELTGPAHSKAGVLKLQLDRLFQDQLENIPADIPTFTSPLSAKLELSGPYTDLQSFIEHSNGTLQVNSDMGLVRNFNLETLSSALASEGIFELATAYKGVSEVKPIAVVSQVKTGVVILTSTEVLIGGRRVTLSGALPILSRGIALNGIISDIDLASDSVSVPFFIGGVWSKPLVTTQSKQ